MNIVRDFGWLSVNDLDSTSTFFGEIPKFVPAKL